MTNSRTGNPEDVSEQSYWERDMGERHVVHDRTTGEWKVLGASTGAAESIASNQADAIDEASRELHRSGGGTVLIHGLGGTVQEQRTVLPDD